MRPAKADIDRGQVRARATAPGPGQHEEERTRKFSRKIIYGAAVLLTLAGTMLSTMGPASAAVL